ncbi:MAG TPA: TIGR03016 family PEP-CTERM system-associated outer membrane protein, partial [Burkholderiales bacterium]|nr:TIGR03016 family PEP-CTERM system-associated outer membrane protein [Burkholderiales bacterium]
YILQNRLPPTLASPLSFVTNQVYRSQTLNGSMAMNGVRNTVLLSVFRASSETQQPASGIAGVGDFAVSSMSRQTGGSATWSLRVTQRTSTSVNVAYTQTEFVGTGRTDTTRVLLASLSHQLGRRTQVALNYRHNASDSVAAASNYAENAVLATLNFSY